MAWDSHVDFVEGIELEGDGAAFFPKVRSKQFIAERTSGGMIEDEYTVKTSVTLMLTYRGVPFEETYAAEARFKSRPLVGVSFADSVVYVGCEQANQELTVMTADCKDPLR